MLYGVKGAAELNADLIIAQGVNTYVCSIDPSKIDRSSDLPYEEQPAWQIMLFREIADEDGVVKTYTLYPDGSQSFGFAPARLTEYKFMYRL